MPAYAPGVFDRFRHPLSKKIKGVTGVSPYSWVSLNVDSTVFDFRLGFGLVFISKYLWCRS